MNARIRDDVSTPDWRGWLVTITGGGLAGALIGSGSSGTLHWDRLPGPITAGAAVALLTVLCARRRPVVKAAMGSVIVVVSCLSTIILRHWSTGHWPRGHVDGKWPLIVLALLLYVCVPGTLVALIAATLRLFFVRARPGHADMEA